jgi:hypothetical protein
MRDEEAGRHVDTRRLLAAMRRDGVALEEATVMEAVEHPNWERATGSHDWRANVPRSLRETWESLPLSTRLCVFELMVDCAPRGPAGTFVRGSAQAISPPCEVSPCCVLSESSRS